MFQDGWNNKSLIYIVLYQCNSDIIAHCGSVTEKANLVCKHLFHWNIYKQYEHARLYFISMVLFYKVQIYLS